MIYALKYYPLCICVYIYTRAWDISQKYIHMHIYMSVCNKIVTVIKAYLIS